MTNCTLTKKGRPSGSLTSDDKRQAQRLSKMIKLYLLGVPLDVIADAVNMPKSTVRLKLKPFREMNESTTELNAYRDFRTLLFSATEFTLLKYMVRQDKLDSANLNQLVNAFKKVYDIGRKEEERFKEDPSPNKVTQGLYSAKAAA